MSSDRVGQNYRFGPKRSISYVATPLLGTTQSGNSARLGILPISEAKT
jgi:hypothetical protein